MQQNVEKHMIGSEVGHIEKIVQYRKVPRARNGQKLRNALHEPEDYGIEYAH